MSVKGFVIAAGIVALSTTAAHAASPVEKGGTQMCIDTAQMAESPVIDNKTILVRMRGGGYKRIDLLNNCSQLATNGFAYETSINRLCVQDTLRPLDSGGVCMIDKIVTIDNAEAKTLLSKKH